MKRPVRKLISFLSAVAMLGSLPLLPSGAAYVAEQVGSDYDAMIRMKNQDIYLESGTAETAGKGTQLVVIGADGEKQLVDLADNVSGLFPFASATLAEEYNFLSPTPAAYSFDFFDPSFQLGGDESVLITKTDGGYALMDMTGKIVSKSYGALSYMGEGLYTTQTFYKTVPGEVDEWGYQKYEAPESPCGILKADGTAIIEPSKDNHSILLTADGQHLFVNSKDGDYFTDLSGKKVSDTYPEIMSFGSRGDYDYGYDWVTGSRTNALEYSVYRFKNSDGKYALSFGALEPETPYYSSVDYDYNWYYDASNPDDVQYYLYASTGEEGADKIYYALDGRQLEEDPREKSVKLRQSESPDEGTKETPAKKEDARFESVSVYRDWNTGWVKDASEQSLFKLPSEYKSVSAYKLDGKVYYAANADGYFTIFDGNYEILQEHIDGYVATSSYSPGPALWYTDVSDGWEYWRSYNAEPAHFGLYHPEKGVLTEAVYGRPSFIPENEHFFAQHDKTVVVLDLDGNTLHEFSDNYGFATVTHSAYEPFVINGTDADTGKPTSVVYDAIADTVKYEQTGTYDKLERARGDAIVVTNYEEENASLWTDDSVYCQGLIHFDGEEIITPTKDMYVMLENSYQAVTRASYSFALDTSFYCEKGETKVFAILRNHPHEYSVGTYWRPTGNEGVYVDVNALDTKYRTDHSYDVAAKLSDGNYAIVKNGKWGLADSSGAVITEPAYDAIFEYQDGLGLAVTYSNEDVIDPECLRLENPDTVNRPMPHVGVIDSRGNVQLEPFYDQTLEVGSGMHRTCGVKDRDGDTIYTRQVVVGSYCRVNYANISKDEVFSPVAVKYGYDSAAKYGDFYVVTKDGLKGIVTEDNTEILPVAYADVMHFVADEYSLAYVSPVLGKTLSAAEYTDPFRALTDGSCLVSVKTTDGKIEAFRISDNGASAVTLGDLNGDSSVNATDAAQVLIAAANIGAGKDPGLTDAQKTAADVNSDGSINATDAAIILQYAAAVGAGQKDVKITDFVH